MAEKGRIADRSVAHDPCQFANLNDSGSAGLDSPPRTLYLGDVDIEALRRLDTPLAWNYLREARDEDIPLVWAALTIARDEYPELDVAAYEQEIARFAARARTGQRSDADVVDSVRAVNRVLFDELGFQGNQNDYYDPRNSYLNEVVDRRLGIPISLAVLQMELARHMGLPMRGVSFPGHFLVSLAVDGGLLVLDPYHRGRSIDAAELKQRAKPHLGDKPLRDDQLTELLAPASNRAILVRMLRNLKALYAEKDDYDRALRCTDRLLTLDADQPTELRDRGLLYLKVGHLEAAREDLKRYVTENPEAEDIDKARDALIQSSRDRRRLN
jgi:regulator of sirC expression with transglutaminase-like and TPR domain